MRVRTHLLVPDVALVRVAIRLVLYVIWHRDDVLRAGKAEEDSQDREPRGGALERRLGWCLSGCRAYSHQRIRPCKP